MIQKNAVFKVELIKNRLFMGGRIFPVWRMFRKGQLTGNFVFSGQDWSTVIELTQGSLTDLVYRTPYKKAQGSKAFDEFKRAITGDETARYTVYVPEIMEN